MIKELEESSIYHELFEIQDDIICYADCENMEGVARYYVGGTGMLGEVFIN